LDLRTNLAAEGARPDIYTLIQPTRNDGHTVPIYRLALHPGEAPPSPVCKWRRAYKNNNQMENNLTRLIPGRWPLSPLAQTYMGAVYPHPYFSLYPIASNGDL